MNLHERSLTEAGAALPPAARSNRRRWIVALVAGLVVLGAAGVGGVWYFSACGDCGRAPILCSDPCELPTFG